MITAQDYFGRTSNIEDPTPPVLEAAADLLLRVNEMLLDIEIDDAQNPHVNSGWRPARYNATVPGAAPKSKHITGQAIDLADPDGELDDFLMKNQDRLVLAGLWMEHPLATKGWCHLQSVPPRSGNRVFYP